MMTRNAVATLRVIGSNSVVLGIMYVRTHLCYQTYLFVESKLLVTRTQQHTTFYAMLLHYMLVVFVPVYTIDACSVTLTAVKAPRYIFKRPILIDIPDLSVFQWA